MPFSIAACRTVLPFSTATCCPSIVSVTLSIFQGYTGIDNQSSGSYSARLPRPAGAPVVIGTTRTRLSFTGEWLTAALFLVATLVVAVLVVRELRTPPQGVTASRPAG